MSLHKLSLVVLQQLYALAAADQHASLRVLSRRIGETPTRVGIAELSLDRAGYVDARRFRLTLEGLALAVALAGTRDEACKHENCADELRADELHAGECRDEGGLKLPGISSTGAAAAGLRAGSRKALRAA